MKTFTGLIIGAAITAIALAGQAHADNTVTVCPDKQTAIAGHGEGVTCEFAHNVREAYLKGYGDLVAAYDPVTNNTDELHCKPDLSANPPGPHAFRCTPRFSNADAAIYMFFN